MSCLEFIILFPVARHKKRNCAVDFEMKTCNEREDKSNMFLVIILRP